MGKYVYPALFHPNEDDGSFTVTFPDLPGCITEGHDLADAIYMAQDALEMWLWYAEDHKEEIPAPSMSLDAAALEFVNLIGANTTEYRKKNDSRAVKKTLSIPAWMNAAALEKNLNFSQVLQDALKERLSAN